MELTHNYFNADIDDGTIGFEKEICVTMNAPPNDAPKVSIIIPTYGRKQYLAEAVTSVIQQSFSDWELFIVDDSSPTPLADDQFLDPRIKVLHHKTNRGPAAARNTGAAAARGDWLAFLDDDDLWDPRRLEIALKGIEDKQADISIVWTLPLESNSSASPCGRHLEGNRHGEIMAATIPNFGATMIRRKAFLPLNEAHVGCEDLEWWIRVSEHSNVTTVREPLFIWRRHDGPRHGNGIRGRIMYSQQLLVDHEAYFRKFPSAYAFRSFRLGYMFQHVADYDPSAAAYWDVLRLPGANAHIRASATKRFAQVLPRALLSRIKSRSGRP